MDSENSPASATPFHTPSEEIWKSYLIIPKFVAPISMIASAFLARDIIKKWREKKIVPLNNGILLGISVVDIIGSFFSWFMTSWMVPKGDAPFAAGNQATCDAQGFIVTFTFVYFVTAYTGLAALYWCIVARAWKEAFMRRTMIRLIFLLPPIIIALVFAIVPLFYEMYNIAIVFCYVAPYPNGCDENPNEECHRGESARLVQTVQFAYSMACNVAIIIFMKLLAYSVYSQERKGDAYLTVGQRKNRRQTHKTAWQGFRFVLAFTIPHIAVYIFMMWNITGEPRGAGFYALFYFQVILNPLVGLANAIVYYRPRYDSFKEQNPDDSMMDCIFHVLNVKFPQCQILLFKKRDEIQSTESCLSPLIVESISGEEVIDRA